MSPSDRQKGTHVVSETAAEFRERADTTAVAPARRSRASWVVGVAGSAIGAGIVLRLLIPAGWDPTIFVALGDHATTQTEYAESLLGLPFVGLVDAVRVWLSEPLTLIVSVTLFVIVIVFIVMALPSRLLLAWGALPFAGMVFVLSANVLAEPFNSTRIFAPILTAFPFLVMTRHASHADEASEGSVVLGAVGRRGSRGRAWR